MPNHSKEISLIMTNGNMTRRGFIDILRGGAAIAALGAVGVTAGCSTGTEAKADKTPGVSTSAQGSASPDVIKNPENGALPTAEQLAGLTPEQITQAIMDYLGLAETPADYAKRRVDVINMTLQAGCTKAEVDENMLGTGKNGATFLTYINTRYVTSYQQAIETPGEKNAAAGLEWDNAFFAAAHLRGAVSLAAKSATPYKAVASLGDVNVTKGNPASTKEPFSEVFTLTLTDNYKESGVNQFFPNSELPLDLGYQFTTDVVPSVKNGKPVLTSTGLSSLRTK